uniref:Gibberellin regulated protein n=1 Tax=Oryza glaberrima TaxID=4538 RepID=I1QS82_ORYGL
MDPASRSLSIIFFLVAVTFVVEVSGQKNEAVYHLFGGEGSLTKNECPGKCSYRCSATSHTKACMTYCKYCCERCLCVPSGTYGNKEECPCYNNMKTQEGKPNVCELGIEDKRNDTGE